MPPLVKHVGPLLPGPAKPLPPELQTFLDGAEQGVVVAWMSSGYKIPVSAALGCGARQGAGQVVRKVPQALSVFFSFVRHGERSLLCQ